MVVGSITGAFVFWWESRDVNLTSKIFVDGIGISFLCMIPGPVLTVMVVYWFCRGWLDSLPIDDDDKRVYPWQD